MNLYPKRTRIGVLLVLTAISAWAGKVLGISPMLTEPFLQNVKTDGITIMWETSALLSCSVEYGLDSNYGSSQSCSSVSSGSNTYIYQAVLTGLEADRTYHFRAVAGDYTGPDRTFNTASSVQPNFSFSVWVDSQGTNHGTYPADPYEPTKSMMAHMAANGIDIALSCGDLAENGNAYYDTHAYYLNRVAYFLGQTVPWYNAWGNHDGSSGSLIRKFADMPSKDRGAPFHAGYGTFSFDYAGCHFLCIDDLDRWDFTWIENDLAAAAGDNRFIFVFCHRPPYCELWINGDSNFRNNLVPLMEQYGVDVCFSGHTHEYERGYLNGVYYCITGGGSWLDFPEPLIIDWPHITVGGYNDLAPGIDKGLVNEYVRVDVTDTGFTSTLVAFYPDGTVMDGVTDSFSKTEGTEDTDPPTPDPMTWATEPYATGTNSIAMAASTAADPHGVEYYFECTSGGGYDSGWQSNPQYEDTGLIPDTPYSYVVYAQDKSSNKNITLASEVKSATTLPDTVPPTPDSMGWETPPYAVAPDSIVMIADTASDPSGVEYYFECTLGNGHNSGWQDEPTYVDTGLVYAPQYTYRVKARDKSTYHNETGWSAEESTGLYPEGDFQQDGIVDLVDLKIFSEQYLQWAGHEETDGFVVMEAEHYTQNMAGGGSLLGSSWVELSSDGSMGDGYMQSLPDQGSIIDAELELYAPHLSYLENFTTTGDYYLWIKAKAVEADTDNSDRIHFGLDGHALSFDNSSSLKTPIMPAFTWISRRASLERPIITIESTGLHYLDFWMREDGASLDRLLLVTDEEYNPVVSGEPTESSRKPDLAADLDGNGVVDLFDYARLAHVWLEGFN